MNNYKVNVNGRTFVILNCDNMLEAFDKINKEFNANKANIQVELFEEDVISLNDNETFDSVEEPQNMYVTEPAITPVIDRNIDIELDISETDNNESVLKKTFPQQNLILVPPALRPLVVPMSSSDILMNHSNQEDQFINNILLENL